MKIFDIVGGEVVIDPTRLLIPEFKRLWEKDKSKSKNKAMKELSYIVFKFDLSVDNPYRGYSEYERDEVLKRDIFNNLNWHPDKDVLAAIAKFQELMETTNVRVLLAAKQAAEELAKWFRGVKASDAEFSVAELSRSLKEVGSIIKSLAQLEDMVKKEQLDKTITRGGSDIGMYEIPRDDISDREVGEDYEL